MQTACISFLFFGGKFQVDVTIAQNLNDNFPVAVDLVVVYDKGLEQQLKTLTAKDWFGQKSQILRDHPKKDLDVIAREWVPGQSVPPLKLSYRSGSRAVYVFASYFSPGDHRQFIAPGRNFLLRLGEKDFQLEEEAR